ncbi:prephenate dehydrogenase/arogenate dehydrogenase family protein [Salinisphaera sp. USBA-960]|nr:prephenate dehydrogenase/arogenate dehydrogenase family protein [Salifodinibacter halophilus]NNC26388.1 prephenate dehydrogenase/arogenate dehydrogenase family protein [Salifodinibacter halophilus]
MNDVLAVDRIAIVGLGLIGGSIALGLARAGFAGECVGAVVNADERERALSCGLVDHVEIGAARAATNADVVIVAVPLGQAESVFSEIADVIGPQSIVTDVGSAKADVMANAQNGLGAAYSRFVPGHPIAGTEHSGPEAGFAELFDGRRVVLTPDDQADAGATAFVSGLWQALGAHVTQLSAATHDRLLAATSHLPHALAFTLVDALATGDDADTVFDYAGGGFADLTRIAASDPAVWRDIFAANRNAVVAALDDYIGALGETRRAIANDDAPAVFERIQRAQTARSRLTLQKL